MGKNLLKSNLNLSLPLQYGDMSLSLIPTKSIYSIMPFKGKKQHASENLKKIFKVSLPKPNQKTIDGNLQIISTGMEQWFIIDCDVDKLKKIITKNAAVTEQSDGWVRLLLLDNFRYDVMARLCPVEPTNASVVRTQIAGMMSIVSFDDSGVELFFMRSMIETAIMEIELAMKSVSAQEMNNG
ncbi:MAG: hypothetical protein ISQ88_04130 [Rhodobacteraceae bacterium]|nr:hypothetical protein [Paracoccaceae bacterium]